MRAFLMFGFLASLFGTRANAAEFPPPGKLPSKSDLPDPLVMFDGSKVATKDDWFQKRRPELKALFEHYMYGKQPAPMKVSAKVNHEDPKAFGGKATLREVVLMLDEQDLGKINLLLVTPNGRKDPAPLFVGMNFSGNHSLVKDPKILLPTRRCSTASSRSSVAKTTATQPAKSSITPRWLVMTSAPPPGRARRARRAG